MIFVVGSGPAGIAAAIPLVEAGLQVTMLDGGLKLDAARAAAVDALGSRPMNEWDPGTIASFQNNVVSDASGVQIKYIYGSDFPYQAVDEHIPVRRVQTGHLTPSLAEGGFSNVWGSAVLPYRANEIADWPIRLEELEPGYRAMLQVMNLSAAHDDLEELFPLYTDRIAQLNPSRQSSAWETRAERHRAALRRAGLYWGRARLAVTPQRTPPSDGSLRSHSLKDCAECGLCLYGCPYRLIYSTAQTLAALQQRPNFRYHPGVVVERVHETEGEVVISGHTLDSGTPAEFRGDRLFLGAGVLSSTRILIRSLEAFDQEFTIRASEYFLLPMLTMASMPGVMTERLHTMAQIFLECLDPELSQHSVHMQLYSYSNLYERALQDMFGKFGIAGRAMKHLLLGRMMAIQGYLHSDNSSTLRASVAKSGDYALTLRGVVNPEAHRTVRRISRKLLFNGRHTGAFAVPPMLHIGAPGDGRHAGGSFPMRETPRHGECDALGRPAGLTRVHVVDSTVFPSVPASTITFTVMANAWRIANHYAGEYTPEPGGGKHRGKE